MDSLMGRMAGALENGNDVHRAVRVIKVSRIAQQLRLVLSVDQSP
jgi:hypothetical protein